MKPWNEYKGGRINFRLTPDKDEHVRRKAAMLGMSVSDYMRHLLDKALAAERELFIPKHRDNSSSAKK